MPANSIIYQATPLDRLSPLARCYLQNILHTPSCLHPSRQNLSTRTMNITPAELTIFLLVTGTIIALLCLLCYMGIKRKVQDYITKKKLRLQNHRPRDPESSCEEVLEEIITVTTPGWWERVGSGFHGWSHRFPGAPLDGEREQLITNYTVGNNGDIYEGLATRSEVDRKTYVDRVSDSSGKTLIVHRDDCQQSCGTRRRTLDYYIV
jgi:hypothetical protein